MSDSVDVMLVLSTFFNHLRALFDVDDTITFSHQASRNVRVVPAPSPAVGVDYSASSLPWLL